MVSVNQSDKKAIIFGASGFIGSYLYAHLINNGWSVTGTFDKLSKQNLIKYSLGSNLSSVLSKADFQHTKPTFGIICSTFGDIDSCKRDIKKSRYINVDATIKLIEDMNNVGIKPVFCSTDYVFSGNKGNYLETDHTDPITVYGAQKADVENIITEKYKNALIVRFSKIFSCDPDDNTLLSQWYRAIKLGETIRCANDQYFCPTYIMDIVEGIRLLLEKDCSGLFHLCQPVVYNRLTLLKEFASYLHLESFMFQECSTSEFNFLDNRSKNTSLNPQKFLNEVSEKKFKFSSIKYCFEQFKNNIRK